MNKSKILMLTQLALLCAIEVILSFTPLGFIMIPPVAITVLHIPVIVGAFLTGPAGGALLGAVFGICSVIKATTAAVMPADMAFSPFLASSVGGNPVSSLFMAVGVRILFGLLAAYLFRFFKSRGMKLTANIAVSAVVSSLFHTVAVLSCLAVFFSNLDATFAAVFTTIASLNGILEIVSAALVGIAVCKPLIKMRERI